MSILKTNAMQIGQSATATNNFTMYQPATPDGTVRLGVGNAGSVTDIMQFQGTGLRINSLGVDTNCSGTAGEIRATNNITAYYSDERLKRITGNIENALDKVQQLNGFYYYENEVAKSLGYNNNERQVGVSAQEVEKILPEVIADAPINNNFEGADYKTVRYEKLVPLLIEAIKEQQQQIEDQQKKIDSLYSLINNF